MKILLCILFTLLSTQAFSQKASATSSNKYLTAKELFLCSCISEGFKKDSLLQKDTSGQLILEHALENSRHSYEYMNSVSELGRKIANSFHTTPFGTRSIFIGCINFYKSKKLDEELKKIND